MFSTSIVSWHAKYFLLFYIWYILKKKQTYVILDCCKSRICYGKCIPILLLLNYFLIHKVRLMVLNQICLTLIFFQPSNSDEYYDMNIYVHLLKSFMLKIGLAQTHILWNLLRTQQLVPNIGKRLFLLILLMR